MSDLLLFAVAVSIGWILGEVLIWLVERPIVCKWDNQVSQWDKSLGISREEDIRQSSNEDRR